MSSFSGIYGSRRVATTCVLALLLLMSACGSPSTDSPVALYPVLCHTERSAPYNVIMYLRVGNRGDHDTAASTAMVEYTSQQHHPVRLTIATPPVPAHDEVILTIEPPQTPGGYSVELPAGQLSITLDAQHVLVHGPGSVTNFRTACDSDARW